MVLILNLVLCALVIVMVVTPLARAITGPRPDRGRPRRQTPRPSTAAASRIRTPLLGGSER